MLSWLCTRTSSQVQPSPSIASVCPPRSAALALKTVSCVCGLSTSLLFSSRPVASTPGKVTQTTFKHARPLETALLGTVLFQKAQWLRRWEREGFWPTICCYSPEHEGPVSLVSASSDGLRVLGATSTGNLGFLDVRTRRYSTLMRSHMDTVCSFCVDGIRRHLATASTDGTVRIWSMDSLQQVNGAPPVRGLIACYYIVIAMDTKFFPTVGHHKWSSQQLIYN